MDLSDTEFLRTIAIFQNIAPEYMAKYFGAKVKIKQYKAEETIFSYGDDATTFYIVKSGWVRLFSSNLEGKEITSALYNEGSFFEESTLLNKSATYHSSAQALEESVLIEIPMEFLNKVIAENHSLALDILSHMSTKMAKINKRSEHICVMSSSQRIGCFLLQIPQSQVEELKLTIQFPVKKGVIANYLGMNFETFSRSLKKLESVDVFVKGDHVMISDLSKLEKYVCGSCSGERACDICFI